MICLFTYMSTFVYKYSEVLHSIYFVGQTMNVLALKGWECKSHSGQLFIG